MKKSIDDLLRPKLRMQPADYSRYKVHAAPKYFSLAKHAIPACTSLRCCLDTYSPEEMLERHN